MPWKRSDHAAVADAAIRVAESHETRLTGVTEAGFPDFFRAR
jgi:hypothetical protein